MARNYTVVGTENLTHRGKGRPKGSKNKIPADVRLSIATFARQNVECLSEWLNRIQDPAKKMELFLRAIEYHIPKVARTEIVGPDGGPLQLSAVDLRGLSDTELATVQKLMVKAAKAPRALPEASGT